MIDTKLVGGIAVVTLVYGKVNALDTEFCEALAARFAELRSGDTKAVVLTGQGKAFSAGVDLIKLSQGGADYICAFLPSLHKLCETVFFHPKPVVAAINGHAIAGGCVLACCADRRIMARGPGRIGVTELLVGLPFPSLAFEVVRATVPARYAGRRFYEHNAQITLMRTTAEENERMGRWIGERLNAMDGPVRFFLPEGGVSALDAPGQPFWDPDADTALFRALDQTMRQTSNRQLIRLKPNINEPEFAAAIVAAFRSIVGRTSTRRRVAR